MGRQIASKGQENNRIHQSAPGPGLDGPVPDTRERSLKFSGSSAVASRNRLLRLLAPFVATFADVATVVLETCVMAAVSPAPPTEIAASYFPENLGNHLLAGAWPHRSGLTGILRELRV